jgi:hypothetical protein
MMQERIEHDAETDDASEYVPTSAREMLHDVTRCGRDRQTYERHAIPAGKLEGRWACHQEKIINVNGRGAG